MKSLQEVLEGIEAFKKDMEELGVDVTTSIMGTAPDVNYKVVLNISVLVKKVLEENLEEG
ncbi:hypothetical protein ES705_31592 [subsurface metagenome]